MSNDEKSDLIYAILAMDSYNRGYGSGITRLDEAGAIGLANIRVLPASAQSGWKDAGFYAISYELGSEIVISYRGTDNKGLFSDSKIGGSDPVGGYGIALGATPGGF